MTVEERMHVFRVNGMTEDEAKAAVSRGENPAYGMRYKRDEAGNLIRDRS